MVGFKLAIDGPAGSGKTTISQDVAKKLGWIHIDTGAMYRAVTYYSLQLELNLADEKSYKFLETIEIKYDKGQLLIAGIDVTNHIRSKEVNDNVSLVSSIGYVREKLVEIQKALIEGDESIVMDGRDIGTVVIPNAQLKIFLIADIEERAKRRILENMDAYKDTSLESMIEDLRIRDYKDSHRTISPLKMADDAIEIDSTYLTIDEVSNKIIELVKLRSN